VYACGGGGSSPLASTAWQLATLDGRPALTETTAWLRFEDDGRFGGSTGCNSLGGKWETDGSKLTLSEVMTTLIGCPGAVGEQEAAFNAALGAVTTYAIEGDGLTLSADGTPRLIFEPRRESSPTP
jgi:heat shock protein HslJ